MAENEGVICFAPGIGRGLIREPARYRTLSELNPATGKRELPTEAHRHRENAIKEDFLFVCLPLWRTHFVLHDFDLRFGS